MGIHKAMKNESKDVLFRIPKSHYFRTRYREMSIPMAPSSEIFIDDISKKSLIFKEKGLDLIGRAIGKYAGECTIHDNNGKFIMKIIIPIP